MLDRLREVADAAAGQICVSGGRHSYRHNGMGFVMGRQALPRRRRSCGEQHSAKDIKAAGAHVLEAPVAAILRATESMLLAASDSGDTSLLEGNHELAQSLVESNRLYALAPARAANCQLASLLRRSTGAALAG